MSTPKTITLQNQADLQQQADGSYRVETCPACGWTHEDVDIEVDRFQRRFYECLLTKFTVLID